MIVRKSNNYVARCTSPTLSYTRSKFFSTRSTRNPVVYLSRSRFPPPSAAVVFRESQERRSNSHGAYRGRVHRRAAYKSPRPINKALDAKGRCSICVTSTARDARIRILAHADASGRVYERTERERKRERGCVDALVDEPREQSC